MIVCNFILLRLRIRLYLIMRCVSVVTCFDRSLKNKRDSGFFIFGQVSRFIHKLCVRCLIDRCVPNFDDWNGLLSLHIEGLEALLPTDFLNRLNLSDKMDLALEKKAATELSDKSMDRSRVDSLVKGLKAEFCDLARKYYLFLIEGVRKHVTMTSNNVRGMACFDPYVMCEMPIEFVTRCFSELYRGFRLRGFVQDTGEQLCRDEYISVLTHLRGAKTSLASNPSVIHDVVDYLSTLPALKERAHVYHLFNLSCLCLTTKSPSFPVVSFGSIRTDNLSCRSTDVILPVQSFFANLSQSVPVCTTDSALESFFTLCVDFGSTGLDSAYDPWRSVDYFGRSKIYKKMSSSQKLLIKKRESPRQVQVRRPEETASEVLSLRPCRRVRISHCFGSVSESDVVRSISNLRQGSSKD